jgi:hypothetical protein
MAGERYRQVLTNEVSSSPSATLHPLFGVKWGRAFGYETFQIFSFTPYRRTYSYSVDAAIDNEPNFFRPIPF